MLRYQQILVGDAYIVTVQPRWRPALVLARAPSAGVWWASGLGEVASVLFTCRLLPCSCFPTQRRWPSSRYWTSASTVFCAELWHIVWLLYGRLLDSILPFHI